MRLTLVRHATLLLEVGGCRVLVDPMLDAAGDRPAVESTPNSQRNPTVPLPMAAEDVVAGVDAVLVTHRHRDHLDETAERLLPRDVPLFCQPEDEEALRALGLDARSVAARTEWNGLSIARTGGRHGTGALAEAMGPVSGFVLGDVYILGDTVWYEDVEHWLTAHAPRIAVVNAGGARFLTGDPITMTPADVAEVVARVPTVVAVHMEAINHCVVGRAELLQAVPAVLAPADGETLEF